MSGSVGRLGFCFLGRGRGHDDILDKSPLYKGVQSGQGWMDIWVWERGIEQDRIGEDGVWDYGWAWAWALGETRLGPWGLGCAIFSLLY
jgi:hypothetical protein